MSDDDFIRTWVNAFFYSCCVGFTHDLIFYLSVVSFVGLVFLSRFFFTTISDNFVQVEAVVSVAVIIKLAVKVKLP